MHGANRHFTAILLCVGMAIVPVSVHADLFAPDRPLFVTETTYFTLIYPQESGEAAAYLASFADETYREVAGLLGTTVRHRLPVVITPDHEVANGYYTNYPYPRIVLYQAAIDPNSSLGSFRDDLKAVFLHELTHAVSLSIRSPAEEALVAIFGAPLGVSGFLAPMAFVEGVTVSFESLDGYGRATDPLAGAMIRQDILEGNWKSFRQAAGAWDNYPSGSLYYIYGGYFSRYLQQRFGMDAYAELWREFGAASMFTPFDDTWLRHGRFREIFGESLSSAWEDFRLSMMTRTPVLMSAEKLTPPSVTGALTSHGTRLLYYDAPDEAVRTLETDTGHDELLFRAASPVTRLDVSKDGSRILVSTVEVEKGFSRLVLKEWDKTTKRLRSLPYSQVRDAVYLERNSSDSGNAPSMAGIMVEGYRTDLVALVNGNSRVLLRGTEHRSYASPVLSSDGSTLYTLAREDGVVAVLRLRLAQEGETIRASAVERLVLPAELSWVRYLSFDNDVLRFAWDDSSFYRLVEVENDEVRAQQIPISGGVHSPVAAGNRVYYIGHFTEGNSLCAFPEDTESVSFTRFEAVWEDASELISTTPGRDSVAPPEATAYKALRWLFPRFWLPTATVDINGITSAGAVTFIADPAERFDAALSAAWNFHMEAVDLQLELAWTRWSMPIAFKLFDTFPASSSDQRTRISGLSLGVGSSSTGDAGGDIVWNVGTAFEGYGEAAADSAPYVPWTSAAAALESTLGYMDVTAPLRDREKARGFSVGTLVRMDAPLLPGTAAPLVGLEASIAGYLAPGAFKLELHGAVSLTGGLAYGPDGRVYPAGQLRQGYYPVWAEFAGGTSGPWFAEAEASFRLLGAEIQKSVGALYANRVSVRMGVRGTVNTETAWSAFSRLSLTWTPAIGSFARLHPLSYLELWARPDLAEDGYLPHGLSFMLVSSY